jgi:hypothetical protein
VPDELIIGLDYELDADGRWVFTASCLLKRGVCCGSGCRNCPYDHVNVSPPAPDKPAESERQDATTPRQEQEKK